MDWRTAKDEAFTQVAKAQKVLIGGMTKYIESGLELKFEGVQSKDTTLGALSLCANGSLMSIETQSKATKNEVLNLREDLKWFRLEWKNDLGELRDAILSLHEDLMLLKDFVMKAQKVPQDASSGQDTSYWPDASSGKTRLANLRLTPRLHSLKPISSIHLYTSSVARACARQSPYDQSYLASFN